MFRKFFAPIDLTKGNIYKSIILFSLPIFLSYIFQQFYSLTDAIIVGQNLTPNEVNGVNDVGSIIFIILQFAFGCGAGFSVVSSRKKGENDYKGLRQSFFVQIILSVLISLILTIISISCLNPLLSLIGLSPSNGGLTYESAKKYLFIIFLGILFQVLYNQIVSLLRSIGDSFTPLLCLIFSTILNIILDLIFIVIFKMGVSGAALATIIAQGLSALICYIYTFIKYPYLRFKKDELKINPKFYVEHLKLGLPLAFQFSILGIGLITMQSTIVKFDTTPLGVVIDNGPAQLAYGATNKIQNFLMCPLNALGSAMLSFSGQNFGAKNYTRLKKGTDKSFIIMICLCLIILICEGFLLIDNVFLKIFYNEAALSDKTIYLGRLNLILCIPFYVFLGSLFILRCSIQGVSKPLFPFLGGIFELIARILICLYGPLIFVNNISTEIDPFVNNLPFLATYFADPFAWMLALIPLFIGYYFYIYKPYKINLDLN